MTPTHQPWLVALSLLMAFQGSYVGLHLARQIGEATGLRHRRLIASSALSLALAIWTMHFVGMLAVDLPVAVDFLVLPTLLSFLVCVLVVGIAVFVVGAARPTPRRLAVAALFMGAGIVVMHHLGMLALHNGLHLAHNPLAILASTAIGVAASGMALWFGFGEGAPRSLPGSALLMALGISAMHYTAMAGTALHAEAMVPAAGQPALSPGLLAVVVSVVAFLVSGLFLLTLVPLPQTAAAAPAMRQDEAADPADGPASAAIRAVAAPTETGMPPADGPGWPAAAPTADAGASAAAPDAAPAYAAALPVERDGGKRSLDTDRLVAVRAQAHYTQLFDGGETWFCPLTISEVESRLDPALFSRIHRSHIVRLDRIAAHRRVGDAGEVTLAGRIPYTVPVARSRQRWLKDLLAHRRAAASEPPAAAPVPVPDGRSAAPTAASFRELRQRG